MLAPHGRPENFFGFDRESRGQGIELGALLATGSITDPQEKHFLTDRYSELEAKSLKSRQPR